MDFVQRNLINERNNLQIELAKAKLLIAELSEAYSPKRAYRSPTRAFTIDKDTEHLTIDKDKRKKMADMSRPEHKGFVSNNKELVSDNVQGLSDPAAVLKQRARDARFPGKNTPSKSLPFKSATPSKRHFTPEQTQYISDLENVVIALAESMNMSVEDLIEYNSPRNLQRLAGMARSVNSGTAKPMGGGVQPAGHLKRRVAMMLGASGVKDAGVDSEDRIVASQRHPSGGYNQHQSVISDKTPIEFNNPDVKAGEKVDYNRSVRFNSIRAQGDRTELLNKKAAAAERASRTY